RYVRNAGAAPCRRTKGPFPKMLHRLSWAPLTVDGRCHVNGHMGKPTCIKLYAKCTDELLICLRIILSEFYKNAVARHESVIQCKITARDLDNPVVGLVINMDCFPHVAIPGGKLYKERILAIFPDC